MTSNPYESPEHEADLPQQQSNWLGSVFRVLAATGILLLLAAMFLPFGRGGARGARESARRMSCSNNLHNIAIALRIYHDTFGVLPPAYTIDADGKPLHSWRTLILPYLEQKQLYQKLDLSKPWDDPANKAAFETNLKIYRCPSANLSNGKTTYLAVVAQGGCFKPSEPQTMAAITDRTALTLMVIEVSEKHAVHWMSPNDATEEMVLNREADGKFSHPSGSQAAFVDGSIRFLTKDVRPDVLRALISIAGNDDNIATEHR